MWGRVKGHTRAGGAPEPLGKGRSAGTARGTRHKGYLPDVAAQGGHHAPGVPLHALHQPVVPRAARGVQRGRALRGQRRLSSPPRPGSAEGILGPSMPRAHLEFGNAGADLVDVGQGAAVEGSPAVGQPQLLCLQLGGDTVGGQVRGVLGTPQSPQTPVPTR